MTGTAAVARLVEAAAAETEALKTPDTMASPPAAPPADSPAKAAIKRQRELHERFYRATYAQKAALRFGDDRFGRVLRAATAS